MATYDIYLQGKTEAGTPGFKSFTFGYDRTLAVRGPYKLAIQWLKRFLTTRGSDPCNPDDGTDFPSLIGSTVSSIEDIRDVILLAIQDCNAQIYKIQQQQSVDLDEQLLTATMTDFQKVGEDGFEVWVSISNARGRTIVTPLPVVP